MLQHFQRWVKLSFILVIFCTLQSINNSFKRLSETRIVLQERFQESKVSFFGARAEHCMKAELQVGDASSASRPQHLMTVIISVTMTTTGCSTAGSVVLPTQSHTRAPEIRTGSSSLMVFMEVTSICLCSWCVSSCCLSSIIFDIFVIPGEKGGKTEIFKTNETAQKVNGFSSNPGVETWIYIDSSIVASLVQCVHQGHGKRFSHAYSVLENLINLMMVNRLSVVWRPVKGSIHMSRPRKQSLLIWLFHENRF